MEFGVYEWESENEQTHWWFVNRRRLFQKEIERLGIRRDAKILDIGTSTGTNLRMLSSMGFTNVIGLDFSETASAFCRAKGFGEVAIGSVTDIPFSDDSFDLVVATDIIEHVDDDSLAVREISRVIKPGGSALITVPAFQSLWGPQDELSHHKRRYLRKALMRLLSQNHLHVAPKDCFYFNYFLFAPIFLVRRFLIFLYKGKSTDSLPIRNEGEINTPFINMCLDKIMRLDIVLARTIRVPFGVSCLAVCRKNQAGAFGATTSQDA